MLCELDWLHSFMITMNFVGRNETVFEFDIA